MARFNITLPGEIKDKLQEDAEHQDSAASTLIADYIEEHFAGVRVTTDREKRLQEIDQEYSALQQRVKQHREEAAQTAVSHQVVVKGLQHELELVKTNVKNLEEQLFLHKGIIQGLEKDKELCQKQLELVTLRLPAPSVGFWARVFGPKKPKKEEGVDYVMNDRTKDITLERSDSGHDEIIFLIDGVDARKQQNRL
jgi:predicted transcriptional regulator